MLPKDRVVAVPMPGGEGVAKRELIERLLEADVWVHVAADPSYLSEVAPLNPRLATLEVPAIDFAAFHPDVCYAADRLDDRFTDPHYNSAIVVWAYKNGLNARQAASLFTHRNFRALGYYDWQAAVETLRRKFAPTVFDYKGFLSRVKRAGVFMHSMNHPKIEAIWALAAMVAERLGSPKETLNYSATVPDGLATQDCWPVYPEIADQYAVPTCGYVWTRHTGEIIEGLDAFVEFALANYARQKFPPERIYFGKDSALYDRVLSGRALAA